ncbi:MAG TPA: glycosyltransferase family 39 protein [Phycisphaerales bacterium]|nr:glycosyltransferase family 39 protein [Phycisphaerales bacterium]
MSTRGGGLAARAGAWVAARRWRQAVVLIAVCAAVFLPRLGATGLSMSEGHRVIPAWEMLHDARAGEPHWLMPRMFGTAYLRKPPGMLWAIAASSAAFGETEFAARLPSAVAATLLALAVWWFGTRWFGSPWGLAAGLAQALLPVTWPSARSAEIESLHMLTTGVACLLAVELFRAARAPLWVLGGLAVSGGAMLLTKGIAGFPICVPPLVRMKLGPLMQPRLRSLAGFVALVLGLLLAAPALQDWISFRPEDGAVVRQSVDEFLWEPDRLLDIFLLAPVVLLTMLPASLALLFPWGPDAARERALQGGETLEADRAGITAVARVLGRSVVIGLVALTALGISNPRYGLPACAIITPLAAYVARGAWGREPRARAPGPEERAGPGAFVGTRPGIARAVLLRSPLSWPIVLLIGAGAYIGYFEPHRRASSGRGAGIELAAHLPDGAEIWADELVEARPEVLLYAVREAEREGRDIRVRWLKREFMPEDRPENLLLLLREDELVDEVASFTRDGRFGRLIPIARGEVHKYRFVLVAPDG